ncbi:hypothetical protein AMTRI_Chr07g77000 [Amborella trichopoda]
MQPTKKGLDGRRSRVVVLLMVPFPIQGHLNALLNFARSLAECGLPVVFACSDTHMGQATQRAEGWDPFAIANLSFHLLPLPHLTPGPRLRPQLPSYLLGPLGDPVRSLARSLARNYGRVAVVHDPLVSIAAAAASKTPNAEAYGYRCVSACGLVHLLGHGESLRVLPPSSLCVYEGFAASIARRQQPLKFDQGILYNSFEAIEGQFLQQLPHKAWAVGPILPLSPRPQEQERQHGCIQWLDKQAEESVLYVSFGTISSLSAPQVRALAEGLEASGQPFLWVLRHADKGDILAMDDSEEPRSLPDCFEERVKGRGFIVRDWAPQLQILGHSSTAGFLSHCGWNSCMESIFMGVPIATWPMHSDQPANSHLVTKILGMGVAVRELNEGDGFVIAEAVERAVRSLMASEEGSEVREKALRLRDSARQAEGGTSHTALNSFLALISRP